MAVAPLIKIALLGEAFRKSHILDNLQQLGSLHLIPHSPYDDGPTSSYRSTSTYEAYTYLKACPKKRKQSHDRSQIDIEQLVDKTLAVREKTVILEEEKSSIKKRIRDLSPWGDFDFRKLHFHSGLRLWFYILPLNDLKELQSTEHIWQCVNKDNRFAYVVIIAEKEPGQFQSQRVHTGDKPLSWLTSRMLDIEEELENLFWKRVELTRWLTILAKHLAEAADKADLRKAMKETFSDNDIFIIEAWTPETEFSPLKEFADSQGLLITTAPPSAKDSPPTLLRNPEIWSGGQSLVHFYTTPAYSLWDPSAFVFIFFTLFFGMIISDCGYGLILAALLLLVRKKLQQSSRQLYTLMKYLTLSTIVYGVLCGSYFGVTPQEGNILQYFHLLDSSNQTMMMNLSIIIGILHICCALIASLFLSVSPPPLANNLGWLLIIIGGTTLYFGSTFLTDTPWAQNASITFLVVGALVIVLFSSRIKWHNASLKDHMLRLWEGLVNLSGISKLFGDVLSYLRLFALGLASTQLAATFNALAKESLNISGIGTLGALFILFFGHTLNLLLGIMSGVVHGLRLNFIEFFNWGLAEEGIPFRAFAKRRISIWNQL